MTDVIWDGLTQARNLNPTHITKRQQLAQSAKAYNWPELLDILTHKPQLVNVARLGGMSLYAPLHQAAHGGAPIGVVQRLLELGAWRTLRTARGETPLEIAQRKDHTELLAILNPVLLRTVPAAILQRLQVHFHAHIRARADMLVIEHALRLPELEPLLELEVPKMWFAVPGMHGGFSYRLVGEGENAIVLAESWSRVVEGSEERHVITPFGSNQIDEGWMGSPWSRSAT